MEKVGKVKSQMNEMVHLMQHREDCHHKKSLYFRDVADFCLKDFEQFTRLCAFEKFHIFDIILWSSRDVCNFFASRCFRFLGFEMFMQTHPITWTVSAS